MKKSLIFFLILSSSCIASAQQINYDIFAVKYSSLVQSVNTYNNTLGKDSVHVDFMIWVIKGNNGKTILVDAGYLYGVEEEKNFEGLNYLRPDSSLPRISIHPDEITDIILSHEHWDHIDYKDLFPKAMVWIQKEDYEFYTKTSWQKGGINESFNKKNIKDLMEVNKIGRLVFIEGNNQEIIPGITILISPAQSYNLQYMVVKTASSKIPLASDNVWLYYNLDHITPAPKYGTFDAVGYIRELQRIKTLVTDEKLVVPGQDAVLLSTFPLVSQGIIKLK